MARGLAGLALALAAPVRVACAAPGAPVLAHRVTSAHPHDPQAFTQGLLYHDGRLYESTGLRGRSSLRVVELASGRVLEQRRLPEWAFGEGLARFGDELLQLTWRAGVAFRWRLSDLAPLGQHRYRGEGWGLAGDGERLWMSDGSDMLVTRDPHSFEVTGRLRVHDEGRPVHRLNELEFAGGALYANVWQSAAIARIDTVSGAVGGWLDLSALPGPMFTTPDMDVLNGIAWDAVGRRFFVTGKRWSRLFGLAVEGLNLPD